MSRSDGRRDGRARDAEPPTFRERLGLAARRSPVRGLVVALLLLLSLGFLVAGVVAFRRRIQSWLVETLRRLLGGDPAVAVPVLALLGALGVALALARRR